MQLAIGLMHLNGVMNQENKFKWIKGAPEGSPLPGQVTEYLNQIVFPYFFKIFDDEDNKEVIERVLSNIRELSEDLGPAAFKDNIDKIVKYMIMFLEKKTFCQTRVKEGEDEEDLVDDENEGEDEEEEEDSDDGIDHDEIILGNVTDIIYSLARAFGDSFTPYF